ncbi:MAG: hypothetical protein GDA37_02050 [Ekhidna sp.]|nr:hypothetical protein [Ekhidna sp.]
MRFVKAHILCFVLFLGTFDGFTQRFSNDRAEFRSYAVSKLKSIGTESAFKIAFDFQNAWDGKFTSQHQDRILEIALEMQKKGYPFYPYFYHYFTYLAYSVTQENLSADQLRVVLEINYESVLTLSKSEYKEFLFGLNIFFQRRYLSHDKTFSVQALDGTYDFSIIGDQHNFRQDVRKTDTPAIVEELGAIADTEEEELPKADEQGWNSDGWGNDQDWDNNQDPWENTGGSWSNSDSWGNNDDWGEAPSGDSWSAKPELVYQTPKKAQRPEYIPVIPDYLIRKRSQYLQPPLNGPAIEIVGANLIITTPHDLLRVKNLKGNFLLKNRNLLASQGSVDWPERNEKFRGAVVQLSDFYLKKDYTDFWTPNAKLQFGELTGGEQVEGVFEYRSISGSKRKLSEYPIFTSDKADQKVRLNDERLSYTGGIQLKGNKLFGKSVSRESGTLTILDKRGNYILLKSREFDLGDSLVSMNSGSITIVHGSDSIYHKSVRAKYDLVNEEFKALRNNTLMPFRSSYFDMNINIDLITWDMNFDSISLEIMNGKDLLPATFESRQFFSDVRYKKLSRALSFHPLNAAVLYALKYDLEEFYVAEMATEYGINENFAKAAGKVLFQYGFADYNSDTGYLKLYPGAFHYYYSSARKFDYDNLMIPSKIKAGANAYIQLESGKINVRGVSRFFLTTDRKIFAEPEDGTVTILKGRDLEFNGMVRAGDFQFRGIKYLFNYDEFLFNLTQIDSIRLTVPLRDSTHAEEGFKKIQLQNKLTATSGTLFVNSRDNKSGVVENGRYPYFDSDSESTVYFDGPEILNGAYDKSVRFIIPPFEVDSIEREDSESITFEGTFNSGGIFPTFPETLRVQEDGSLGFTHQIPNQGYNLYGTEARTYEKIRLSNEGIRGYGQIDFLTTTIYSDDFIYYPDSVTTDGTKGVISPGDYDGASYPEAVLSAYDMYWLPGQNSMYLHTVDEPFKFYNSTAELSDGFVNITTNGVYGGGTLITRGSRAKSGELNFKEFEYSARHTDFEVLTDNPAKPAMAGKDIRLYFELRNNTATIRSEKVGEAAISFPYAQMKTSISEAFWDLEDSVVTMIKPPDVPLENSYFYTTREDLDSLAFNGERASYDINTQELIVEGIPFIIVADSKIIPEGNQTTVLANSVLRPFTNAEIIIDTLNGYHYLDRAQIRVISRSKFEGSAFYKQIIGKDTFDIRFDTFELQDVPVGKPDRKGRMQTRKMTVSGGEVTESQNLIISPGFFYKGSVIMYASKPALALEGTLKPMFSDPDYNRWVMFKREAGEKDVQVPINETATFEDGSIVVAGIHKNARDNLYFTFIDSRENSSDHDFFKARGFLTFDDSVKTYRIETPGKTKGESYAGTTMIYDDASKDLIFEGLANFINPLNAQLKMKSSILGVGNGETSDYSIDAMFSLDLGVPETAMYVMADDLIEIIERMGPPVANDISKIDLLYKLANYLNEESARSYEESSLRNYVSLASVDKSLEVPLFVSGVKMNWDKNQSAWYNKTKLGISNIYQSDINAKLDGFLEIKKDEAGADAINLFIQGAPGVWYYLGYTENQLLLYSSNAKFNAEIQSKSNVENVRPGELALALGTENETLGFINDFRLNYLGIKEPYNLISPDDINLEDESFETIEKDDDGFGF